MNSTSYAKRTQYKPIDMFFRGVFDVGSKTRKVVFVDVFQVLNDRYLGRMNVCNYFAIAENSVRVNELNIIALDELKNYHLVMKENFLIPDTVAYCLPISTRFLESDEDFEILLSAIKDNGYKKGKLILSFFASTFVRLDSDGKKRYNRLRRAGFKTAVGGFNEDFNSLDVFTGAPFDYLRCEAGYFDAAPNKKKLLHMLLKFCSANKISLVMEGVDSPAQCSRFKREGVKLATGRAISKLSRWVTNEFLHLPEPVGEKKEAYLKKLEKELSASEQAAYKELLAMRSAAEQKANALDPVMPSAPRPELAKSPYQLRLEQQRKAQKRAAEETLKRNQAAMLVEQDGETSPEEKRLMSELGGLRFEGDVQSALALTFARDKKSELGIDRSANGKKNGAEGASKANAADNAENAGKKSEKSDKKSNEEKFAEATASNETAANDVTANGAKKPELLRTAEESGIKAPLRPEKPAEKTSKPKKTARPDFDAEARLMNEFRSSSLSQDFGLGGMGGFGITLHIDSAEPDTPPVSGHYDDDGKWVDEDGNVYNGYFDEKGHWVEYEAFDENAEGSYNENGQWIDKDGNVYDGYFDEQGRWIDYTYTDSNSEIVDNGYFDDKLGKWVPFGYFDENGTYHRF